MKKKLILRGLIKITMAKENKNTSVDSKNVEFDELTTTENFFDKNKNILISGGVGIVVVLLGFLGYNKLVAEPNNVESQIEIASAMYDFESDSTEAAINGTNGNIGLEEAADEYKGTSGGDIANYSMGIISMQKGEFETALDYFGNCSFEDVMVANLCIGLQGDCYVELTEYAKAVDFFEKAAAREVNEFTTPLYLKKAGLAYEALEDYSKAIVAYTKIKNNYPQSSEGADITKYIERATK